MSISSDKYKKRDSKLDIGFEKIEEDFHANPDTMLIRSEYERLEKINMFLKEVYWYEQCDKNKGDQCEHRHCQYSILTLDRQSGFFCGRRDK